MSATSGSTLHLDVERLSAIDLHVHLNPPDDGGEAVLFGSDYPFLTPDHWMAEFDKLPIRDEVRPLILKDNAVRLLGLAPAPAAG